MHQAVFSPADAETVPVDKDTFRLKTTSYLTFIIRFTHICKGLRIHYFSSIKNVKYTARGLNEMELLFCICFAK